MKKPIRSYSLQERLAFSNGHSPDSDSVFPFLATRIPNFKGVRRTNGVTDKTGCDYVIERHQLFSLAVDLKLRSEDYSMKPPHYADDLALETFSVVEKGIIGWTRDASKTADYILWYWQDTGRFFIIPFPPLCCAFQKYWPDWRDRYGAHTQHTPGLGKGWHSECIYVPRSVVTQAVTRWMSGSAESERIA